MTTNVVTVVTLGEGVVTFVVYTGVGGDGGVVYFTTTVFVCVSGATVKIDVQHPVKPSDKATKQKVRKNLFITITMFLQLQFPQMPQGYRPL